MDWLIALIQIHAVVRVMTILASLVGIAWSLRTIWRLHVATARQRQEEAAKRRQARIRPRSARQPIASPTPSPAPTPPPDDPRQEDLLSALASQETGRMPAMDLGQAETRRLGAPVAPTPPPADADTEDGESTGEHATRYPIDGGAVTRRDLRPPSKDISTQILRDATPDSIDSNLQAAIRDAVEDSLREDGSETFFKDFADAEHDGDPTSSTTTGLVDEDRSADIGAETTSRMPPTDTDLADNEDHDATTALIDTEGATADDDALHADEVTADDDDLEARRRRRRVSQEIIQHNAQRHEELGLHIGITPDGQGETQERVSDVSPEDKQRRLRQLGLVDTNDDDAPDPVHDVMARVEAAISAMGGDDDAEAAAPSDTSSTQQPPEDGQTDDAQDDQTDPEEGDTGDDDHDVTETTPEPAQAAPSLSVPDWARADTFDEDLDDDGGNAPRQHHLFD